jgi:hypothetical protein
VFGQRLAALAAGIAILITATGAVLWIFSAMLGMELGLEPLAHGLRLTGAVSVLAAVAVIAVAGGVLFARHDLN